MNHRLSIFIFILASAFLFPESLFASTIGITPSVIEEQVERGEVLNASVSLVRANPSEDVYVNVSTRDDEYGAISLTSGERFRLPLGEYEVRYTFSVDTSKLADGMDRFKAGIEFLNEGSQTYTYDNSTNILVGNVLKVDLKIVEPGSIGKSAAENGVAAAAPLSGQDSSKLNVESKQNRAEYLFIIIAAISLLLCLLAFLLRRKGRSASVAFASFSISFFMATIGWGISSGRVPVHLWQNAWQTNIATLKDGAYFLRTSYQGPDVFLNPSLGQSQEMFGSWLYVATSANRVYALPLTDGTSQQYDGRMFRFHESSIQPLGINDVPGTVSVLRENNTGTYAIFSGISKEGNQTFWCLSEVFESSEINCTFLDRLVAGEIQAAFFSNEKQNILFIQTKGATYEYDVWRKTLTPLDSSLPDTADSFELALPLETAAVVPKFGFVKLDGSWIFARGALGYYRIAPSLWLERSPNDGIKEKIFLVDTRSFTRVYLADVSSSQKLYWLQKGGFITSP